MIFFKYCYCSVAYSMALMISAARRDFIETVSLKGQVFLNVVLSIIFLESSFAFLSAGQIIPSTDI